MSPFACCQNCFDDDDDIERLGEILVEHLDLVNVRPNPVFCRCGLQVLRRNVVVIDFVAIPLMGTVTGIRTLIAKLQRGILA